MSKRRTVNSLVNPTDLAGYIRWYARFRWYVIIALAVTGIVPAFFNPPATQVDTSHNVPVIIFAAGTNLLISLAVRRQNPSLRYMYVLAYTQLFFDVILASYLVGFYYGGQNRDLIIYAIPIVVSGALFGRPAAYVTALMSAAAFNFILLIEYWGFVHRGIYSSLVHGNESIVSPVIYYPTIFFILAFVSDYLSQLIRKREQGIARQEMISLASHQIRTPATAVKGILSAFTQGDGGNLSREELALLQRAYEENNYELEIINNLLNDAHLESGAIEFEFKATDIHELMTETVNEFKATAEQKRQTLEVSMSDEKMIYNIDTKYMQAVLSNLLSNASKYSPEGSSIELHVAQTHQAMTISIADHGIGIPKKELKNLFVKYYRASNVAESTVPGTGLGLYFVKRIVEAHGGTIAITSETDRGTIATITLHQRKNTYGKHSHR